MRLPVIVAAAFLASSLSIASAEKSNVHDSIKSIVVGNSSKMITVLQVPNDGLIEVTITPSGYSENIIRRLRLGGEIFDAFVGDIDQDGREEFYFLSYAGGRGRNVNILGFEETVENSLTPIKFTPQNPDSPQYKGYRNQDDYQFHEKKITHNFPLYEQGDAYCCPSGGARTVEYRLVDVDGAPVLQPTRYYGNKVEVTTPSNKPFFDDETEFKIGP